MAAPACMVTLVVALGSTVTPASREAAEPPPASERGAGASPEALPPPAAAPPLVAPAPALLAPAPPLMAAPPQRAAPPPPLVVPPPPAGLAMAAWPALAQLPVGVRLSGYIQADAIAYDQSSQDEIDPSTGAPLNQTRYLVRRARLHLDVDHGHVAGSLELDGNTINGPSAGIIDAEVTVRAPAGDTSGRLRGEATIGLLRTPFGWEVSQRDQDRFFLERSSMSRALFPGVFDVGARARGGWRFLQAEIALMNGHPLGDRSFPGQDPNRAKDVVGRLEVAGRRRAVQFAVGLSGLIGTGFHRGTPETKDVLVWRDQNQDGIVQLSEIEAIPGSAATPSQLFHRFALDADARITAELPRLGELEVFFEGMWGANLDRGLQPADPVSAGRDLRERGWMVGAVQQLGDHLAIGGRYDQYDPDADAAEQRAVAVVPVDARFTSWTATLAWRWSGLDRVAAEYQHVSNPLGRTAAGAPTTLGGDTLAVRGQLAW
jgi:hypothetical protein